MAQLDYSAKMDIAYTPDVLVVGGGPSGLCAAIAAARGGAKTMLVEQNGFCGGMATAGLVAPFMTCYDSAGNDRLIKGIFSEIVDRLCAVGGAIQPSECTAPSAFTSYITVGHIHVTPFRAEALKLIADRMLAEAGVEVLYHASFIDAIVTGRRITDVIIREKGRFAAIRAKNIIDCTGDGDIAAAAGVPYELGDKKSGRIQPASMFFRIGSVDSSKIEADYRENINNFYRLNGVNYRSLHWWVEKAREAGDWNLDRVSIGLFRGVDEDEWSINTSRVMGIDGTDSQSLSRAEREGREQVDQIFRFFVKYVPGCANARLLQTGSTVGIRETRHISGRSRLTVDDLLNCRVPEDSIMVAANSVDVHGKFGPRSNEYIALPAGKYYGIPFSVMVPETLDNLLVSGRAVSADSDAAGAIRVMPPCMALGQAAGTAAALAVKAGIDAADCDVTALRETLTADGARVK